MAFEQDRPIVDAIAKISGELSDKLIELGWSDSTILTLDRQDLVEILPGDKNLLLRKKVYNMMLEFKSKAQQNIQSIETEMQTDSSSDMSSNSSLSIFTPKVEPSRIAKSRAIVMEKPDFQLYTDEELREAEGRLEIRPHLVLRLVQCTVGNMISATQRLNQPRYPTFQETNDMASILCGIYPGLNENVLKAKMKRRLQNVKPRKHVQGRMPQRSRFYKKQAEKDNEEGIVEDSVLSEESQININAPLNYQQTNEAFDEATEEMMVKQVDSIMSRHITNLSKEMEKRTPDKAAVTFYMDAAFEGRRDLLTRELLISERLRIIQEKFPALANPVEMINEVRRILDPENKNFFSETVLRLDNCIQSLAYYAFSKKDLLPTLIDTVPVICSQDDKFLGLLTIIDQLFEKKKRKKNSHPVIVVLQGKQDPDAAKRRHINAMPGLIVDKVVKKSIILVGNHTMCTSDDIRIGFLAFLSSFYVLDVEYPSELCLTLTLLHRILFCDNRCETKILEEYQRVWKELDLYFPDSR